MSFSEREGDIFEANDLDALAHGVNCHGAMGGIAGLFAKHYPEMADYYKDVCNKGQLNPGDMIPWKEDGKPAVYNLATQYHGGADASYEHIATTIPKMLNHAEKHGIKTIGIPQIGAGIGGLEWPKVRDIISEAAEKSPVHVVAFSYAPPKPKTAGPYIGVIHPTHEDWWMD